MSRPTPLSGFPELLPAQRLAEQTVLDSLRRVFELHGFAPLETRAVETLEQLTRKGEIDKEVYVLRRLHAQEEGRRLRSRPALRPDRPVRPLRTRERGAPGVPLPPLPGAEGLAG
jgi:histidyl-tRNA synthetase